MYAPTSALFLRASSSMPRRLMMVFTARGPLMMIKSSAIDVRRMPDVVPPSSSMAQFSMAATGSDISKR